MDPSISSWLKAVAANPDDAALRLIFADWLVERGDERTGAVRESSSAVQVLAMFLLPEMEPAFTAGVQMAAGAAEALAGAFRPAAGLVGALAGMLDANRLAAGATSDGSTLP
jgi:uncharacterized protein (TIGR02996 family)